jgi:hypothetical protein
MDQHGIGIQIPIRKNLRIKKAAPEGGGFFDFGG